MTPQYQGRDDWYTTTQNLADTPILADGPPQYQNRDGLHTTTQNLADKPILAKGSQVLDLRWLAYHYTKLGRWTYFDQWTPQYQSRDDLHTTTQNLADEPTLANDPQYQSRDDLYTTTQNLADEPTLADGPLSTRAEMACIPLHKTWQMNLLWLMDPPVPEQRWLVYHYTKLGRWTYFGWWTPSVLEQRWLAYHYTKLGRWTYFGWWIPQYQSRDDLYTTTQNLAEEPILADGPPQYQNRDGLLTTTQNLADEPILAKGSQVLELRWLAYHYTKLGRWTYFGQWTPQYPGRDDLHTTTQNLADEPTLADGPPQYQSRDDLHTTTQNLADEPTLANGPLSSRAEVTCIPLHKTWQMNLLWLMDPLVPEQRWLVYHYTKLGRWTYFGWWTPSVPEQRWLAYHYTKLGRWTYFGQWTPRQMVLEQRWLAYHYTKLGRWNYFGQWTPQYPGRDDLHTTTQNLADEPTLADGPPQYQSRDDLHTTTQNLADEPTLANGPLSSRAEVTCIPLHKTWQMNLLWLMDPLVPEQRWLVYHYTKLGRWTYFGWWTPPVPEQRWLVYHYTKLGR